MWITMTKEEKRFSNLICYAFAAFCTIVLIVVAMTV